MTLIDILTHDLNLIMYEQELFANTIYENGQIKYIDYTFQLDPPELNVFDRIRIRIFGEEKSLLTNQYHVVYYSRFEINTPNAIILCDRLVKIYGADNNNYREIEHYEIGILDARVGWSGRNWWINQDYGAKDFDNPEDTVIYWINLDQTPSEDGFSLRVTGFNNLQNHYVENCR